MYDKVISFIRDFFPWLLMLLGYFFEISKIPISPLSAIRDWILKPATDRIDKLEEQFADSKRKYTLEKIYAIRKIIVDFSDACRNHEHHTQKEFQDIIDLYTKYLSLCEEAGIENGVINVEYQIIVDTYKSVHDDNDFK